MFWIISGVMLAAAVLIVALPLYRAEKKLSPTSMISIVAVAAVSGFMYSQIGTPNPDLQTQETAPVGDMMTSLAARLQENPNDLDGWKMLGRSYFQMQNYPGAIAALEKAVQIESSQNGSTLADLGEAILLSDPQTILGRAGQMFENALALEPSNPKALFYSGMAAAQRGNNELAADRWEALLATSPPPNVQEILRQRIAELRGETVQPQAPVQTPVEASGDGVIINVSLGASASAAGLPDATVYIIARDPNQPAPPVAAVRRRVSELPAAVSISDADAMIAGRVPSGFAQLEIIARVSLTGQPVAQPGDWFGQQIIDTAATETVRIIIDQQVP
ncbi:MAG: tetratricopeptide repeat protein [Gammaproteobacteria bacterium]|jgi:cytochrome c-type biogenesis protein CcmH|nr:tetratricopeptide repeat protein [Gammaproteobacteria bacterium]